MRRIFTILTVTLTLGGFYLLISAPLKTAAKEHDRVSMQVTESISHLNFDGVCGVYPSEIFATDNINVPSHGSFAKQHFPRRMKQFEQAPLACNQIVMLGDSLTESNDWRRTIPSENTIRNRGVGGDTSDGVRTRLGEIVLSNPRAVFLMIGTNDLRIERAPETTVANIVAVVEDIKSVRPDTKVFVQTVPPTRLSKSINRRIEATNRLLRDVSDASAFTLIDTYAAMVDSDGALREAFTYDDVHLSPQGNEVWAALVYDSLVEDGLANNTP